MQVIDLFVPSLLSKWSHTDQEITLNLVLCTSFSRARKMACFSSGANGPFLTFSYKNGDLLPPRRGRQLSQPLLVARSCKAHCLSRPVRPLRAILHTLQVLKASSGSSSRWAGLRTKSIHPYSDANKPARFLLKNANVTWNVITLAQGWLQEWLNSPFNRPPALL